MIPEMVRENGLLCHILETTICAKTLMWSCLELSNILKLLKMIIRNLSDVEFQRNAQETLIRLESGLMRSLELNKNF